MMPDPRRVLAIGLDGATLDVLTPLIDAGRLPNLRALRDRGAWGPLRSTVPPLTAPAWSSFATGMNPGKHGVLQFFQTQHGPRSRVASEAVVNSTSVRAPTLWQRLSAAGLRVGLVNVPMTYPPQPVNGFVVAGMPAPLRPRPLTYPASLADRLNGYRVDLPYFLGGREFQAQYVPAAHRLVADMTGLLADRARATLGLLREEPWDFFMVVFTETDRLGHHVPWPADASDPLGVALTRWYQQLDAVIGELIEAAGPRSATLIMSDHGMGASARRRVYFNDWLASRGLLAVAGDGGNVNTWLRRLGLSREVLARILRALPAAMSRLALERFGRAEIPLDLSRTQAYYVPIYEFIGGLSIVPRDPDLRPGTPAYAAFRDQLASDVLSLVDPATGERVVEQVHRREDLYAGPHVEEAPDLVLVMNTDFVGNHRVGNEAVVVDRVELAAVKGAHRFDGILFAAGDGIARSGRREGLRIEDLAPTIMYLLALPVPREMDGRVLDEVIDAAVLSADPIRQSDDELAATSVERRLTASEEQEVRQQLEGLGYVD